MNLNILIVLLFLSSCTINRFYKTKDIKKNFSKYEQDMNKSINSINKDLKYQKRIISEISIYKLDNDVVESLRGDLKNCLIIKRELQNEKKIFKLRYSTLDLTGEKITSSEKRYKNIESFKGFISDHGKNINKKLDIYKRYRKSFFKKLENKNFKLVKTKELKQQFDSYNSKFKVVYNKTKDSISKFKARMINSNHVKKSEILLEINQLNIILLKLEESNNKVDRVVKSFHQKFGNIKEIIHGPNSPTNISLNKLKAEVGHLNIRMNEFNGQSQKINKIIKE